MYENGASMPFNGVVPESLFQRREEYASYLEGVRLSLMDIIRGKTDEAEILRFGGSAFSAHYVAKGYVEEGDAG